MMRTFKDEAGNFHRIDNGGNHFINKRCVNPKVIDGKRHTGAEIGSTYPPTMKK